jgi:hypothetical protein
MTASVYMVGSVAAGQDGERFNSGPAEKPPTVTAQFQLIDPAIVNDAIPAFFIGRNQEGFWVARDVKGRIGGIFLLENSAVSFARRNSQPAGCATIYPSQRFELDLEDKGNPLVARLVSISRLTARPRQQIAVLVGKAVDTIKRLLGGFQAFWIETATGRQRQHSASGNKDFDHDHADA